jgi:SsrA-binding protein
MGQTIATNKKAFRDYFLSDQRECGIELKGGEVKSVREGHVSFTDSFARVEKDEVFLYSLHIDPYAQASYLNEDPVRKRKLLLHKKEIKRLFGLTTQKNMVLIPTKIYFNNRGLVKVEIALGKGKKLYDKRETIKKRDLDREVGRAVRQKRR